MKLRTGRKVGRTLYLQLGDVPSDEDWLIGVMDTKALAVLVVGAVNEHGLPHAPLLITDLLEQKRP